MRRFIYILYLNEWTSGQKGSFLAMTDLMLYSFMKLKHYIQLPAPYNKFLIDHKINPDAITSSIRATR